MAGGGVGIFGIVSYIHVIWEGLEGFLGGGFSLITKKKYYDQSVSILH